MRNQERWNFIMKNRNEGVYDDQQIAEMLGISKETMHVWIFRNKNKYDKSISSLIKQKRPSKQKSKKKSKKKLQKPSNLTMNDIHKWLIDNQNNIISQRMLEEKQKNRTTWKDQYSKFADFLAVVNILNN